MEKRNFRGREVEFVRESKIYFEGKSQNMSVYKIPIDLIHYNVSNGRIGTFVNDYNFENPNSRLNDLMKQDVESFNLKMEELILKSDKSNRFSQTKENIKERSQQEAGVVLSDGTIIDGNRRFTALRQLYRETSDGKFGYFEAIIIEKDEEDTAKMKSIKILEIQIQHGKDEKVDYSPIQKLVDIYNNVVSNKNGEQLLTDKEYMKAANISKSTYNNLKSRMEIMVDFCRYISMDEKFSIVESLKLDGPINEIANFKTKIQKDGDLNLYELEYKPLIYTIMLSHKDGDITRDLRHLFNNYKNGSLERLFKDQEEIIASVHSELRSSPQGNEMVTISKLKASSQAKSIVQEFDNAVIKEKRKVKQGETLSYVLSALSSLDSIDTSEFAHIPLEDRVNIKDKLITIREKVTEITEKLNS